MSKYLYRFLISIMLMGLGGLTHAAFGQYYPCNQYVASDGVVDPLILERDDFSAPADGSLQQITAPTVPGSCLMIVGAIREGVLNDDGLEDPQQDIDTDTYQLTFSVPIAPTTFILTLNYNRGTVTNDGNSFNLTVTDANGGTRECLMELTACPVQVSGNVYLTITGLYAGVYTLSITHLGL
jgi:hypothetical protein